MPLECNIDASRGVAILTGDVWFSNTTVTVQRSLQPSVASSWVTIRNGVRTGVNPGGLVPFEDPEMPLGQPVFYRMLMSIPGGRFIQRQLISDPMFNTDSPGPDWLPVAPHTLNLVTSAEGASPPLNDPTMALVSAATEPGLMTTIPLSHTGGAAGFVANKKYRLTGNVQFTGPPGTIWQAVYETGDQTWNQLGDTGINWSALLVDAPSGQTAAVSLHVSLKVPGGAVVLAPIRILGIRPDTRGKWNYFAAEFTTPGTIPAGTALTLSHGGGANDTLSEWLFDKLQLIQAGDAAGVGSTFNQGIVDYIDRNTDPDDVAYVAPDTEEYSHDDTIVIEANGAVSWYGPTVTASYAECELLGPDLSDEIVACAPVFLQDPVAPALGMWVGLIAIGNLTHAARRDLYPIVNRPDQVAVSDKRLDPETDLVFMTLTLTDRDSLLRLFGSGRILFMRNADASYPENNWYMSCGDLVENRISRDHRRPERQWAVPIDKVDPPLGLIELTTLPDWQDVKDAPGGWLELAQSGSWLDVTVPGSGVTARTRGTVPFITRPTIHGLPTVQSAVAWDLIPMPPQGTEPETVS